jgi:RND family efflux transporter MFP subunit
MRHIVLLFTVCFVTLLIGWGCSDSGSKTKEVEEAVPVQITEVNLGSVVQSLDYTGDIEAELEVRVFSKIPDRITTFFVDEGDPVKKGDPIARVLATTIEQTVRQTEAGVGAAKAQETNLRLEYDRAQRLYKEDALSKQQFDAIKTQYESVQAQLEQAEAILSSSKSQLNDATVTAPISGIIGQRFYEEGDMANPALPVVSIVQMRRVKVSFDVTEEDLGEVAIGQEVSVIVKSYPETVFKGKLTKISPILDPLTRMAAVEAIIDNPDFLLKPGMYANIVVTTGVIENIMVVPRYATLENTTMEKIEGTDQVIRNYFVFVIDSNKAVQKKLKIKYANHKSLAVLSGINIKDKLVITGQNNLRDGQPVTIVEEEDK